MDVIQHLKHFAKTKELSFEEEKEYFISIIKKMIMTNSKAIIYNRKDLSPEIVSFLHDIKVKFTYRSIDSVWFDIEFYLKEEKQEELETFPL